ncbi:hypothetical protein [Achromobacter sp.]|uniref:hypothetical protein n=1 Tax=Achromobacter sp. TaxID=134375 RepID=UPI0028AF0030|nr:hypothetical protein [Achromobacter sp.]
MKSIPLALAAAATALLPTLASAAYTPTAIERAVLEYGIREEHDALLRVSPRMLGRQMDAALADPAEVSNMYANGPTAEAPAVLEELFVLKANIDGAAAKAGVVTFPGTSAATVRATLPAGTRPAEGLMLLCGKTAWADGVVTFSQCQDWTPVVEKTTAKFRADIAGFLQGKPTEKRVAKFVIDYFVVAGDMPGKAGCPDDRAACDKAIRKTNMTRAGYNAVEERLRNAGVQPQR